MEPKSRASRYQSRNQKPHTITGREPRNNKVGGHNLLDVHRGNTGKDVNSPTRDQAIIFDRAGNS